MELMTENERDRRRWDKLAAERRASFFWGVFSMLAILAIHYAFAAFRG